MPISGDNQKSVEAIRVRAQHLATSAEEYTAEAEILAAVADGTLSFDEVDEEDLQSCVKRLGADSVVEALLPTRSRLMESDARVVETQLSEAPMLTEKEKASAARAPKDRSGFSAWWSRRSVLFPAAALAAAAIIVVFYVKKPSSGSPARQVAENAPIPEWPSQSPFDPSAYKKWGRANAPLAQAMPNFSGASGTLGATSGEDRYAAWREATVIVRSEDGWGSGTFISSAGWVLTNYHVVADTAQKAAMTGHSAVLDIITDHTIDGRVKPEPAIKATVYRVDPVHDLALLKLDSLPGGKPVAYFPLAAQVKDGENCYVIGSQNNGPAWWIRSGNVSQQFDYPEDLSQFAAGAASKGGDVDRDRVTVIVTDTRISPGDSGGPLLNDQGQLIGLTFATPANDSAGSVGWHIALPHLRQFVANLPTAPEGVPFDPWTAGLPEASPLDPETVDADHDGRIDSLLYRYASPSQSGRGAPTPLAVTVFVDLAERNPNGSELLDRVPYGIWGMEDRGHFHFNFFVTTRADHTVAVGYTNTAGVVDEIRIGTSQTGATLIWRRLADGKWQASQPTGPTALLDPSRFSDTSPSRLSLIVGQIFGSSTGRPSSGAPQAQPSQDSGHGGANVE